MSKINLFPETMNQLSKLDRLVVYHQIVKNAAMTDYVLVRARKKIGHKRLKDPIVIIESTRPVEHPEFIQAVDWLKAYNNRDKPL